MQGIVLNCQHHLTMQHAEHNNYTFIYITLAIKNRQMQFTLLKFNESLPTLSINEHITMISVDAFIYMQQIQSPFDSLDFIQIL